MHGDPFLQMSVFDLSTNVLVTTPCVYLSLCFPLQHMYAPDDISSVYGRRGSRLSPTLAAFVNGVAVSTNRRNRWVVPSAHQMH